MTVEVALTADGALSFRAERVGDALEAEVHRWLPKSATALSPGAARATMAHIAVRELGEEPPPTSSDGRAILNFGDLTGHEISPDHLRLITSSTRSWTDLLLHEGRAEVTIGTAADAAHLGPMLTLAAALLLGRMGRALVHAAAVVSPAGAAWLLVGDTHSGKTTTSATLIEGGWGYCSDDQVVVRRNGTDGALTVEGWPRTFHLDAGFDEGRLGATGRADVDAERRWPGRWVQSAPLGGVLLPVVDAGATTALAPTDAADRFAAIVRQSPWLFADARGAPQVVPLLREIALLPGHQLRLGADSFARPRRMVEVLQGAT